MTKVIKNLKPEWALAEDNEGKAYAYDPAKYLLLPKPELAEQVSVYPVDEKGFADYDFEIKVSSDDVRPVWVKMSGVDLVNL